MRLWVINLLLTVALVATIGWTAPVVPTIPPEVAVDVLVIGGTPGGVAAAIAAARMGASVLLAEGGPHLGGVLTTAWLTTFDMSVSADGEHLTRGIFLEHYQRLGISFDRGEAARVMARSVVREPRLRVMVNAPLRRVAPDGMRIAAVELDDLRQRRRVLVHASQVIDATDDGDVAALAGAPHAVGRPGRSNPERWMQAATLILRVAGVNWEAMAADIVSRLRGGAEVSAWGINGNAAWGYPDVAARYRPGHPYVLLYPLNLARQDDGSVLINALNITGVNGLDPESVEAGKARAIAEAPRLVAYLRETVPGFAHAYMIDHAPALYIRETRHIVGLYTLEADDILEGRTFYDRIAVAAYPIDIHPYNTGWTNPYPRVSTEYTVPLRAIVPLRPDNLLVASRALSATSEAHGSVRVVPTIMAVGQASGVTAALSARNGWTPRDVAVDPARVRVVHGALIAQGAYLGGPRDGAAAASGALTTSIAGERTTYGPRRPCPFSLAAPPRTIRLDLNCR